MFNKSMFLPLASLCAISFSAFALPVSLLNRNKGADIKVRVTEVTDANSQTVARDIILRSLLDFEHNHATVDMHRGRKVRISVYDLESSNNPIYLGSMYLTNNAQNPVTEIEFGQRRAEVKFHDGRTDIVDLKDIQVKPH